MKEVCKICSVLCLLVCFFTGCKARVIDKSDKISVVCSIFPEYDWARYIVGEHNDKVLLSMIVKNGLDLHSFQSSEYDISLINSADLFIYVGGESDKWIEEVLSSSDKKSKTLRLMDVLERDDEHVWLSVKSAKVYVNAIARSLGELDFENSKDYHVKAEKYCDELEMLDREFEYAVEKSAEKTLVFCDRFPFSCFAQDYGVNCFAAFDGCTALTEVSPEAIDFLAEKINEYHCKYAYTIESADDKIFRKVTSTARNYDCESIRLDSMQCTTLRSAIEGKTYLKTMQKNMQELQKGLN